MAKQMLVQMPTGGVHRAFDYQAQPPYTTPDAYNVWPLGGIPGRIAVGSRAAFKPFLRQPLPSGGTSGSVINMGAIVSSTRTEANRYYEDDFDSVRGFFDDGWSVPAAFSTPLIDAEKHFAYADYEANGTKYGLIRSAGTSLDISDEVQYLYLLAVPWRGRHRGTYTFYIGQDSAAPAPGTTGIRIEVAFSTTGDVVTVTGYTGASTVITATGGTNGYNFGFNDVRTIRLNWTTSAVPTVYNLSLYVDNIEIWAYTTPAISIPGHRVGWSITPSTTSDKMIVDWFRWAYPSTVTVERELNQSVWAANGVLCYEAAEYTYGTHSTPALRSDVPLNAVQLNNKLYIADYGVAFSQTAVDVTINKDGSNRITITSAGTDFGAAGVTTTHGATFITLGSGHPGGANLQAGVTYAIQAVSGTTITLVRTSAQVFGAHAGNAQVYIQRLPKVYDPVANTLATFATGSVADTLALGTVPLNCPLIEEYRGRLVFAGGTSWYMSRVFNALDWNYGSDPADPARAISSTLSQTGKAAQPITCLVAPGDDYMILSGINTMYLMRGDPAYGGDVVPTSKANGIVSAKAYAIAPDGLYFLSRSGLMRWQQGEPTPVSAEKVPDALLNLDPNSIYAVMAYDNERRAIIIWPSGSASYARREGWFYHLPTGGFWPFFPNEDPQAVVASKGYYNNTNRILIGSREGWVFYLERNGKRDEWNAPAKPFPTRLTLGPFSVSGPMREGVIQRLQAVTDNQEDLCDLSVYAGNTPQQAVRNAMQEDTPQFIQSLARGRSLGLAPRVRGQAACLQVTQDGGERWRLSEILMTILEGGMSK